MRITYFSFSRFKSFGATVQVLNELDKLNMIFGNNNSGKSNLLKLLRLIFKRKVIEGAPIEVEGRNLGGGKIEGSFWDGTIEREPYIFHRNELQHPIAFTLNLEIGNAEIAASGDYTSLLAEFPTANDFSILSISGRIVSTDPFTSDIILDTADFNGSEMYRNDVGGKRYFMGAGAPESLKGDSLTFENFMGLLNDKVYFLDTDRFFVSEENSEDIATLSHKTYKNWLHQFSLNAVINNKYQEYIAFIKRQPFPPSFEYKALKYFNPSFARFGTELQVMLDNGFQKLPLDSYGTGLQQILVILTLIYQKKARIILIEEVELNLSPKAQRVFFQILRNLITEGTIDQVFFTTHSPYFNFVTDFKLFKVSIDAFGVSTIVDGQHERGAFFASRRLD